MSDLKKWMSGNVKKILGVDEDSSTQMVDYFLVQTEADEAKNFDGIFSR